MRRRWLWLALLLAIPLLAWLGSIVFVSLSIRRYLDTLRQGYDSPQMKGDPAFLRKYTAASAALHLQGCRALPALVAELDSGSNPRFLAVVSSLFHGTI